ncbi:hypothetical protein RJ639_047102 [Escallonia herrerae]|uniref:Retrovirus-related Pol polyprotein from transposon TNT 1-94-like beta-barrel domain-containing protein n=1 Tax=Escallonia herrerae TaxID=1293975 RepID=A0AA88W4T8_9ASTE|nr:hypothetical protein RJ639_047102 [Escallonia herrerae]
MMQALEKQYEKPYVLNKVFLMKRLFNMRMSENGSVVGYLNDLNNVTNQLESVGINFDDEIGDGISSSTAMSVKSRVDDNSVMWYVDSGASIHRDCFSDYVHGDYGHVTVGNEYRCSIIGKGKVKIKLSNGGTLVLKDVRHIS